MRTTALFPHFAGLHIDEVVVHDGQVSLTATAVRRTASCPLCHRRSRRVHSRYHRHVADLPLGGAPVTLYVHARRFFCPNPRCARRIFAERLPTLVAPGGRRSHQLRAALERVAFALGGEAGARLATILGMPTTPDVLLRLIRAAPLPEVGIPERVGVDDFALRKGRTYAVSSWTSTPAAHSTCYPTAPPRRLPHGSRRTRRFVSSAATVAPLSSRG